MYRTTDEGPLSIWKHFKDLDDPRGTTNRKHLLGDILVIAICAVISGADGPVSIGLWADAQREWLEKYLTLPHGIPSHDTIGRVLAILNPTAFQLCFQRWIETMRQPDSGDRAEGMDEARRHESSEIIAIDGKALRRSHDRKHRLGALFLVSAWSVKHGISLGQLATEEKSNEITAIPELIEQIDIRGATVTIDAAGCQKNIAEKIVDRGGNYVLALKGNQGKFHKEVERWILAQMENGFADVAVRKYETVEEGHGRVDRLVYYQFKVPEDLAGANKWKGLRTIGIALRMSQKGDRETTEVRHFLSSLKLGVRQFADAIRGHWSIENTLHWCLDVTFREDESRVRNRKAAENLAWLKRFAISVLKQATDKQSIAMRRRLAGWNVDNLAKYLGLQRT